MLLLWPKIDEDEQGNLLKARKCRCKEYEEAEETVRHILYSSAQEKEVADVQFINFAKVSKFLY